MRAKPENSGSLSGPELNQRIRHFYDRSTPLWLDTWGEHMHHGFYGIEGKLQPNHRQAQIDMLEELLRWGGVSRARRILDAGCGVGGSARWLATRFDAEVLGLTLSPVQAQQAEQFNRHAGLADRIRIEARDMMTLSPEDGPFDLIWSLESAEHIADKKRLLELFFQALSPGGALVLTTWCHRPVPPPLRPAELRLLDRLYTWYHLPPMTSTPRMAELAEQAGFTQVVAADWTRSVAPFWAAVRNSGFSWRGLSGLARAGWGTIKGAWAMQYMIRGYRMGVIRYGVLQGRKD